MFSFLKAARSKSNAQRELIVAFDAFGINFMELHTVIRDKLIRDAMLNGAEASAARFIALTLQSFIQHLNTLDEPTESDALSAISRREFDPLVVGTSPSRSRLSVGI